ncbi:MAG: hypothetical protein RL141_483 [Candidatus Parcubacteria bacterium]|jgi:hypothetical protein
MPRTTRVCRLVGSLCNKDLHQATTPSTTRFGLSEGDEYWVFERDALTFPQSFKGLFGGFHPPMRNAREMEFARVRLAWNFFFIWAKNKEYVSILVHEDELRGVAFMRSNVAFEQLAG